MLPVSRAARPPGYDSHYCGRARRACATTNACAWLENALDIRREVVAILGEVLGLGERAAMLSEDSPLLGAIPELDSMAVVSILTLLEERCGFAVEDDEVDGAVFVTLGSLVGFARQKLGA
ncbi:MAG: acyl carrier protein [Burkholderiales bacterium]|nr:acyl carrier protein [Burkholderiales bacterium]